MGVWEVDTIYLQKTPRCIAKLRGYSLQIRCAREATADAVVQACHQLKATGLPMDTLTFDNGKEFAKHEAIGALLQADRFFARAYHSWESGLNEHTNGAGKAILPHQVQSDKTVT